MARTEPRLGRPAGLHEPVLSSDLPPWPGTSRSFTTSSTSAHSTDSNDTDRPVEAITVNTLHTMLAHILEQTTALLQAQASTNHILDEIRQSIPGPQENLEVHERLRRVEVLVETLAHNRRADLQPQAESESSY